MNLSETEKQIVEILRELKPFENVLITKDQQGRPEHYLITRTQKVIISLDKPK